MAERESFVYKAKLAEQAERYDGKSSELRENARPLPDSVPARGGSAAQVQPFTWIGRTRDKMAELSLAE